MVSQQIEERGPPDLKTRKRNWLESASGFPGTGLGFTASAGTSAPEDWAGQS